MVIRIAELLMHIAEARKTASIVLHPNRLAISKPRANMIAISTTAMRTTLTPTSRMRLQPHSRPIPNRSNTKPRSASSPMVSALCTAPSMDGPSSTPAPRYPRMGWQLDLAAQEHSRSARSHNDGEVAKEVRLAGDEGHGKAGNYAIDGGTFIGSEFWRQRGLHERSVGCRFSGTEGCLWSGQSRCGLSPR